MSSPLRATATLAAGSAVSLVTGAATAKVIAVVAGPVGVGTQGLLYSLLTLGGMIAGFGVGVGLVREVARALALDDRDAVASDAAAARVLVAAASAGVGVILIVFREPLASLILSDAGRGTEIVLIGLAVVFNAMASVEISLVNGFHRVNILAVASAGSAIAVAISVIAAVLGLGSSGIAAGLLVGSIGAWIVARLASARVERQVAGGTANARRDAMRRLIDFGGPYVASQLVGTGAQLVIPLIVLAMLDPTAVGLVRAASTISVGYLAFLLNAMSQDYFPKISAIGAGTSVAASARQQLRFVLMLSLPLILVVSALAPVIVRTLYSGEFAPATAVLRWQLMGDVLKLPSFTLAFVILARGSSRTFLATETIGGVALIALSALGLALWGVVGVGVAYLATYAVYYLTVSAATRAAVPPRFGREEAAILGICALLLISEGVRTVTGEFPVDVVVLAVGVVGGLVSARRLWFERHG